MASHLQSANDLNEPWARAVYAQLILFKADLSKHVWTTKDLDLSQQRSLQALAHELGLEYEYYLGVKMAVVSRPTASREEIFTSFDTPNNPNGSLEPHTVSIDFDMHTLDESLLNSFDLPLGMAIDTPTNNLEQHSLQQDPVAPQHPVTISSDTFQSTLPSQPDYTSAQLDSAISPMSISSFASNTGRDPSSNLQSPAHIQRHKCPYCSLDFTRHHNLKSHLLTHSSEKPYGCPQCQARFRRLHDLKRHTKLHTGERPHTCLKCGRRFARGEALARHNKGQGGCGERRASVGSQASFEELSTATTPLHQNQQVLSTGAQPLDSITVPSSVLESGPPRDPEYPNSPRPALSRANSTSSMQSHRGRSRARPSSVHSRASSGHGEFVFDANPRRSLSRTSVASGRRGPLDTVAKTAMNAVKKVGACWRCKILRKTCDPDTPCLACPKRDQDSLWRDVGCRRGALGSEIAKVNLCQVEADYVLQSITHTDPVEINTRMGQQTDKRNEEPEDTSYLSDPNEINTFFEKVAKDLDQSPLTPQTDDESSSAAASVYFTHLKECISAIVWELKHTPSSMDILQAISPFPPAEGRHYNLCNILYPAAIYQAAHCTDELIFQSLVCLRLSLEVLRLLAQSPGESMHQNCQGQPRCKIDCIASLELQLEAYLENLSVVIFKKENLRGVGWWLSALYSLCIQSIVRKALCKIVAKNNGPSAARIPADEYLYLVVRLFVARSGSYDPLDKNVISQSFEQDRPTLRRYEILRQEMDSSARSLRGVTNPAEFLQVIFEDKGSVLGRTEASGQPTTTLKLASLGHIPGTPPDNCSDRRQHEPLDVDSILNHKGEFAEQTLSKKSEGLPSISRPNSADSSQEDFAPNQHSSRVPELAGNLDGRLSSTTCFSPGYLNRSTCPIDARASPFIDVRRPKTWDEEKKNKLAGLYVRYKNQMWQKIASEMNMPWIEVERMAWQLGEMDINARGYSQQQEPPVGASSVTPLPSTGPISPFSASRKRTRL